MTTDGAPPGRRQRVANAGSKQRLRVALFGSPTFALPVLEGLNARHEVVLVVSQPDKPAGRGLGVRAAAVARRARELGLELWQPTRLKSDTDFLKRLQDAELDVGVTAAYGRILPAAVFNAPRHGVLNVHASLLPELRGAAPIQWALIRGFKETGVSIMQTEAGLDTGPVRLSRSVAIAANETAPELFERLALLGAEALLEALDKLADGTLPADPQDDEAATLAPLLTAEDGYIRWHDNAQAVYDRFRGVAAWPGTSFEHADLRIKVPKLRPGLASEAEGLQAAPVRPGTVLAQRGEELLVAAGESDARVSLVSLQLVKPPGGREMTAGAWANGRQVRPGERLG